MKAKNFITFLAYLFCGIVMANYSELERSADALYAKKQYEAAAEKFWQAATAGSPTAVVKLSKNYNRFAWKDSYNWGILYKYLQAAADAEYKRLGHTAQRYDGRIFIIATEDAIIKHLGIETISRKYWWGGNHRCSKALKNLYRNFYIENDNKKIFVRSQYLGKELGNVVILDRATAEKNFNFTTPPIADWVVFVASPTDSATLIPFETFHRYVYEKKMSEFMYICNELGAKSASVSYVQREQTNKKIGVDIAVDGPAVQTYAGAKAQVDVAVKRGNKEKVEAFMEFSGGTIVGNPHSPWFAAEPTWEAMKKARRNRKNDLRKYTANFSYNDSFQVNVATKTALEKAGFKIGVSTKTEFEDFKAINWSFKVLFDEVIFVEPSLNTKR